MVALNIDSSLFNNFKSLIRVFCLFFKVDFYANITKIIYKTKNIIEIDFNIKPKPR